MDAELMLDTICRKASLLSFYGLPCGVLESTVQASSVKIFSKSLQVAMASQDGNRMVSAHG